MVELGRFTSTEDYTALVNYGRAFSQIHQAECMGVDSFLTFTADKLDIPVTSRTPPPFGRFDLLSGIVTGHVVTQPASWDYVGSAANPLAQMSVLQTIFNLSIQSGSFPSDWKYSHIDIVTYRKLWLLGAPSLLSA